MTPVLNADIIMNQLTELETEKRKLEKSLLRTIFKKIQKKYDNVCDRIDTHYKWLHEFYPDLSHINDVNTFISMRKYNCIPNKVRSAVVNSEIKIVYNN